MYRIKKKSMVQAETHAGNTGSCPGKSPDVVHLSCYLQIKMLRLTGVKSDILNKALLCQTGRDYHSDCSSFSKIYQTLSYLKNKSNPA